MKTSGGYLPFTLPSFVVGKEQRLVRSKQGFLPPRGNKPPSYAMPVDHYTTKAFSAAAVISNNQIVLLVYHQLCLHHQPYLQNYEIYLNVQRCKKKSMYVS